MTALPLGLSLLRERLANLTPEQVQGWPPAALSEVDRAARELATDLELIKEARLDGERKDFQGFAEGANAYAEAEATVNRQGKRGWPPERQRGRRL